MIKTSRDPGAEQPFAFYWVPHRLPDEAKEPTESTRPTAQKPQTMTMSKLPHAGEAMIIDLGEGEHPSRQAKHDQAAGAVGADELRHLGPLPSPTFSMEGKATRSSSRLIMLTAVSALRRQRAARLHDRRFRPPVRPGSARIAASTIEVLVRQCPTPMAVRYASAVARL